MEHVKIKIYISAEAQREHIQKAETMKTNTNMWKLTLYLSGICSFEDVQTFLRIQDSKAWFSKK